jgi:hypothetical protein
MLYQNPAIQSRVEVHLVEEAIKRVDHLSSCLASYLYCLAGSYPLRAGGVYTLLAQDLAPGVDK